MEKLFNELRRVAQDGKAVTELSDFEIDNDPVFTLSVNDTNLSIDDELSEESSSDSDSISSVSIPPIVEHFWSQCREIASQQDQGSLDGEQLGTIALSTLSDPSASIEEVQMALVDMFGFDNLDFVADIVSQKDELMAGIAQHSEATAAAESRESKLQKRREVAPGLSKAEQAEWKRQNRLKAAERNANLAMSAMIDPEYPHVYRQQQQQTALSLVNVKRVLPEGTIRESLPSCEHVVIPAQIPNTKFHPQNLLHIDDLDDLCKVTFSKYKTLNKIQSLVYPVCYESNENMLICAPTGAGKTDVALLSILSTVKSVRESEEDWKIVYVAPLKALAAEITEKLGSRLTWLGIKVRELTGDMQLSRAEIAATHILVTTPEKWDVVTRKPNDDSGLAIQLKLLIIDEVHLLHEERGAVLESLVARTRRQVESQQRPIRIVGLSATLPNFVDVAEFLGVNPQRGLFFFDGSFRPVPLEQQFYGVRAPSNNPYALSKNLDKVAYDECVKQLRRGHSVMIFVHSRRDTTKTAETFMAMAQQDGCSELFKGENADKYGRDMRQFNHRGMQDLFQGGFATHHAGMSRAERNMSEKLFANGGVRVLCSTATLAWGVNLPAAVVIIKGTQVYDSQQGGFVDLGISDVIQIFGRAGRPQFEQTGVGVLCTGADKLDHYLDAITNQHAIESRFARKLPENLNAEITLGTVSNINEAVQWLGYTYMYVRMRKAPQTYGLLPRDLTDDPALVVHRRKQVIEAARLLRDTQMIVYTEDDNTESLIAKDIGRIASEFYLLRSTVEQFNEMMNPRSTEQQIISLLSKGEDFSGLKIRTEELKELEKIVDTVPFAGDLSASSGKTAALLQAWISRIIVQDTALGSDMAYVAQNSARIIRAFFLLCISRGWAEAACAALLLDRALSQRVWPGSTHPLLQLGDTPPAAVERKLISSNIHPEDMKPYSKKELGDLVGNHSWGPRLAQMVLRFPTPTILTALARPLTSRVVRVEVEATLMPPFRFDVKVHGNALHYWLFVHGASELLHVDKMMVTGYTATEVHKFDFVVPYTIEARQIVVQLVSDKFLGAETTATIDFGGLKLPTAQAIRTDLLRLRPLSVQAWHNPALEQHYGKKFRHFNPMQTMVFHSLYHHTEEPVLLGSPTGSGKTVACEIAVWAALRDRPNAKVVYIAPMKALVKERVNDWKRGICQVPFLPGKKKPELVELTGDSQPMGDEIRRASLVVTTPEKFDGISRHYDWAINDVALVIMDEVHLLASDRGAILEVIVSRMNRSKSNVRLLGMSTAVANAGDLASWLGVKSNRGVFNFPSSVRPVPLEMYIDGFPEVQGGFCPFMKSMNKPAYLAIKRHSPKKPALVFVPSRRQTRLTANDLISLRASDEEGGMNWLHTSDADLASSLKDIKDETLKHTLQYGIAIHHAGLEYSDRQISHDLFARGKVQILVATSTLAWGVNLPAYLVVVKGTQFFDAKLNKYKDMDLTDVLQMMGRAGRPAYDTSGVSVVFTKQSTKQFYKYFLNLGFPVESSLHKANVLENHLGAEMTSGRVNTMQEALEFMAHTFLFRRIHSNPSYYTDPDPDEVAAAAKAKESESSGDEKDGGDGKPDYNSKLVSKTLVSEDEEDEEVRVNRWLVERVNTVMTELSKSSCLATSSGPLRLRPTPFLSIASFYYISHLTMRMFLEKLTDAVTPKGVLQCLALATEYDELAIRHNEDLLNAELSKQIEFPAEELGIRMVDPHIKVYVLVQARMRRLKMPAEDYIQDTITVLDQAIRILQALIDTAAQAGLLKAVLATVQVLRNMKQGVEATETRMVGILPGVPVNIAKRAELSLATITPGDSYKLEVSKRHRSRFVDIVKSLPRVEVSDDGQSAKINPGKSEVYCPAFHKPQYESWFIITTDHGKIVTLERVKKPTRITAEPGQTVYILNDTCAIDYIIGEKP